MLAIPRKLLIAALCLAAGPAAACSCFDLAGVEDPKFLAQMVAPAEAVVHARVVAVPSAHEARIEAIEWFKGKPVTVLHGKPAASSLCGLVFRAGEEAVFFVYRGQVNLCGRQRATPQLLERLRSQAANS